MTKKELDEILRASSPEARKKMQGQVGPMGQSPSAAGSPSPRARDGDRHAPRASSTVSGASMAPTRPIAGLGRACAGCGEAYFPAHGEFECGPCRTGRRNYALGGLCAMALWFAIVMPLACGQALCVGSKMF